MIRVSRRIASAAFAVSAAAALAQPAFAGPGRGGQDMCRPGATRLSVSGQGEARVAPDLATIQLGVTTQAPGAAEAMEQNATRQTAVIDALADAGIAPADIRTSGLTLSPMLDYAEGRAPTVTGYQAGNMVSVRVRDVTRLGAVLDSVVAAGANEINGIAFTREDSAATRDEAQREAVKDARHKAGVLAEAAGLTLGPVLVLRDAPASEGPRPMMMEARAAGDAAKMPIAAGDLAVAAMVEMEFALTPPDCAKAGSDGGDPGNAPGPWDGTGHDAPGRDAHAPDHGHGHGHGPGSKAGPDGVPGMRPPHHPPVPPATGAEGGDKPAAGDLPPPMGTDSGAPAPGEPLVPMGESDRPSGGADAPAPTN